MTRFSITPKQMRIENGTLKGHVIVSSSGLYTKKTPLVLHISMFEFGNYDTKITQTMPDIMFVKGEQKKVNIALDTMGNENVSLNVHVMEKLPPKKHVSNEVFINVLSKDKIYGNIRLA